MDSERRDVLSDRLPEQHYGGGVEAYYSQAPLLSHNGQDGSHYHPNAVANGGDSAYSRQSSFDTPSEPAPYVLTPQPTQKRQTQRQRSANLAMLRVSQSPCCC